MESITNIDLNKKVCSVLHENLLQQLNEVDLLKSMYPDDNDLVFSDPEVLNCMRKYVQKNENVNYDDCIKNLDFTIFLKIENLLLELCVNIPQSYPSLEKVGVNVRCNQLNRRQETEINRKLSEFVEQYPLGEVILYSVISWLQENIYNYCKTSDAITESLTDDNKISNFTRYWIYSHHIYNKKKRIEIQKQAKNFDLTGFCIPGKPGLICVEGHESNCQEWWKIIKSMTWQKISLKKIEAFSKEAKLTEFKFSSFDEMHFSNASSRQGKHCDISELSKYLDKIGLSYVLNEILGLNYLDN